MEANAFIFDPTGENSVSGVFLDMSRINNSYFPNADYSANFGKGRMELCSTRSIGEGEEVTISYGHEFLHKTAEERNSHLQFIYGFIYTCRAFADPDFKAASDRRRKALKEDFYCGMHGHATPPDFSAKAFDLEGPSSIRPGRSTQDVGDGFSDGIQISRPGTLELMRRSWKLKFDEGLRGETLLGLIFIYSSTALIAMHKRMRELDACGSIDGPETTPAAVVGEREADERDEGTGE